MFATRRTLRQIVTPQRIQNVLHVCAPKRTLCATLQVHGSLRSIMAMESAAGPDAASCRPPRPTVIHIYTLTRIGKSTDTFDRLVSLLTRLRL
jgi:hypothetical protein